MSNLEVASALPEGADAVIAAKPLRTMALWGAAGVLAGIALKALGVSLTYLLLPAGVLGFCAFAFRKPVLLLAALLLLAGCWRYGAWQRAPNPLTPMFNTTQTLSGNTDGTYLTLDAPRGASVVLSPRGEVPAGYVRLRGLVVEPARKRNPGGFDYAAYLRRRGVGAQVFVDRVMATSPAQTNFKDRLRAGVVAGLPADKAALAEAMTLGIRDHLEELEDTFAAAGLAHILALSGFNFGILIAFSSFLLLPLARWRYPVMLALVAGFMFVVDASPSVVRAGAMAMALLLSLTLGWGKFDTWAALALAAVFALLWQPQQLFDLSFQLSYLAVLGLLIFSLPVMKALRLDTLPWWDPRTLVVGSLVVSLAAQALLLPLLAHSFHNVPLLSPLVNIIAIPLATPIVPLGMVAGLVGLVSLPAAAALNHLNALFCSALIGVAKVSATWPSLTWGEISPVGFAYYGLGALALALVALGYLRLWRGLLVALTAMLCSMYTLPQHHAPEIVFLDVGQGDSTLIRLPGRVEILVDGGGTPFSDFDIGENVVVPALRGLDVDELELVIATHPDTDHIEGLISVLKTLPVERLIMGHPDTTAQNYRELIDAAIAQHTKVTQVRRGEQLQLAGAELDFLNPTEEVLPESNANSVAFVLRVHASSALFLGDLPAEIEAQLKVPKLDILKVAHHGSRFSTSEALLNAAQPNVAVISYGRNTYGHPNEDVLGRLKAHGVRVQDTFHAGAIRLPLP